MTTTTGPKSLLTRKDNERLSDLQRVLKLRRIARRATCKAEWLTGPELTAYYRDCSNDVDRRHRDNDVRLARARAQQAGDEIVRICRTTTDPHLLGRLPS